MAVALGSTGPDREVYGQVFLTTEVEAELDFSGFESIKVRIQLGAADEFTIKLPAQTIDGVWRADMPIWSVGGVIRFSVGYDGEFHFIQQFEIVSTKVAYPSGAGGEMMTILAVSDLVRAARQKRARKFSKEDTFLDVIGAICADFGWENGVQSNENTTAQIGVDLGATFMAKKQGISDLKFLKQLASYLRLGGPRVDGLIINRLTMPEPVVGDLVFARGAADSPGARRLHKLNMNREGGQSTRVVIIGVDPVTNEFVQKEFEVDKFSGDANIVFEGTPSVKPLQGKTQTNTFTIAVVEHRGHGKKERTDVISKSEFQTDLSAEELASRYFELRERLGRYSTVVTDGHQDLRPYSSFELEGNLANVDKGTWLPVWVEHNIGASGWTARSRALRVIEEPPPIVAVDE
jgi:phage protein D